MATSYNSKIIVLRHLCCTHICKANSKKQIKWVPYILKVV